MCEQFPDPCGVVKVCLSPCSTVPAGSQELLVANPSHVPPSLLDVFIFTDTTVVPGFGISLRLSMSAKFAVCFNPFRLRSGGCWHGARGCLDNKSTEHCRFVSTVTLNLACTKCRNVDLYGLRLMVQSWGPSPTPQWPLTSLNCFFVVEFADHRVVQPQVVVLRKVLCTPSPVPSTN